MTLERISRAPPAVKIGLTLESWEKTFAEIFRELEQPELLFLSLLFHDVGKGLTSGSHVQGSLGAVEKVAADLALAPEERATVSFLIASHLEMSATAQRRDIFDPETIRAFAEKMESPERLKMLTLAHLCDIKAVNPEALTPWKAEMLWRLFAATLNYLHRNLDDERVQAMDAGRRSHFCHPRFRPTPRPERMMEFLEGLPKRYLRPTPGMSSRLHFEMFRQLEQNHPCRSACMVGSATGNLP